MPSTEYELKPVLKITAAAIGDPGKRVFYLQGSSDEQMLTLMIQAGFLSSGKF
jgi:hypothetical protein